MDQRLALPRFGEYLNELLRRQLGQSNIVNRHDLVSSADPGPLHWCPRQRLQDDDAARQNTNDAAKPFALAPLHPLELRELLGIQKSGMWIEAAQHSGNDACIKG